MEVAVFGAAGAIGNAIATELLTRGHAVTGISRRGATDLPEAVRSRVGDVTDPAAVAACVAGHDAVVSAIGPGPDDDPEVVIVGAAHALVTAMRAAGPRRLVVVGGAGTLEVSPGVRLMDTPTFFAAARPNALAQQAALAFYRTIDDVEWTVVSPAGRIQPGERTGVFRVGGDQLLIDAEGKSRISIPDYAAAFVDELESGSHLRARMTVGY